MKSSKTKPTPELVTPITSNASFVDLLSEHDSSMLIVDLHKTWCGPCTVMEPVFQRLQNDFLVEQEKRDSKKTEESENSVGGALHGETKPLLKTSRILDIISMSTEDLLEWASIDRDNLSSSEEDAKVQESAEVAEDTTNPASPISESNRKLVSSASSLSFAARHPGNNPAELAKDDTGSGGANNNNQVAVVTVNDFLSSTEIEKIEKVLEEEQMTCKPLFLFLRPILNEINTSSTTRQEPVVYTIEHIVKGADAPKVAALANSMIQSE